MKVGPSIRRREVTPIKNNIVLRIFIFIPSLVSGCPKAIVTGLVFGVHLVAKLNIFREGDKMN